MKKTDRAQVCSEYFISSYANLTVALVGLHCQSSLYLEVRVREFKTHPRPTRGPVTGRDSTQAAQLESHSITLSECGQ